MRREKILKICLNHILTEDIEYSLKDEKTWLFSAPDFSEGEIQYCQFCLRFKTSEVAQEFKNAVNEALDNSNGKIKLEVFKSNTIVFATLTAVIFSLLVFWKKSK